MKQLLISLAFLSLAACASGPTINQRMAAHLGQNINNIIDHIGAPQQTFQRPDGNTIYTWIEVGPVQTTTNNAWGPLMPATYNTTQNICKISYTADQNNIINRWQWQGDCPR